MKKRHAIKIIMFLLLALIIYCHIETILKKPMNGSWENASFLISDNKNPDVDAILSGTSMVLANINNQELYSNYDIIAKSLGEPEQPTYLSYYLLKDVLEYQKPKVVIFDVQSLFYTKEKIEDDLNKDEYYFLHYTLDKIKKSSIKYEALQVAKTLKSDINFWDYLSTMYYSHSNWENIKKDNYIEANGISNNGDIILTEVYPYTEHYNIESVNEEDNSGELEDISEFNMIYFNKMVELCKSKNIDLVLVRSGFNGLSTWSWEQYNVVDELAKENELIYLDINTVIDEIQFDKRLDMGDWAHFNIVGAKKWTDYIGKIIKEKYLDKTSQKSIYEDYQSEEQVLNERIELVNQKKEFLQCTTFDQYLDKLCQIEKDGLIIAIVVSDEASSKLTPNEEWRLKELGFNESLIGQYRSSYAGILLNGVLEQEQLSNYAIVLEGNFDDNGVYKLTSGGYGSNTEAGIEINETQYCQKERGINIVVYNKKLDALISSVYFDTYLTENPNPAVLRNGMPYIMQDVNRWVPIRDVQG